MENNNKMNDNNEMKILALSDEELVAIAAQNNIGMVLTRKDYDTLRRRIRVYQGKNPNAPLYIIKPTFHTGIYNLKIYFYIFIYNQLNLYRN